VEAAASLKEPLDLQKQPVIDESNKIAAIRTKYRVLKSQKEAAIRLNRNKLKTNYDLDLDESCDLPKINPYKSRNLSHKRRKSKGQLTF
jgi:hypothetical protein